MANVGRAWAFADTAERDATLAVHGLQVGDWCQVANDQLYKCSSASGVSSSWVPVTGLRKSVLEYGAKGDGSTNDRVAIQAAIDALSVTGVQGAQVYFPPSENGYLIDDELIIRTYVALFGDQAQTTYIRANLASGKSMVRAEDTAFSFTSADRTFAPIIRGLTFDNTDESDLAIGINWSQISSGYLRDCRVLNCRTGVLMGNVGYYNQFQNVEAVTTLDAFLVTNGANANTFIDCRALDCTNGFTVSEGDDTGTDTVRFDGCRAEAFTNRGFSLEADTVAQCYFTEIRTPRIENGGGVGTGIFVSSNARFVNIFNPYYVGCATNLSNTGGWAPMLVEYADGTFRGLRIGKFGGSDIHIMYTDSGSTWLRTSTDSAGAPFVASDIRAAIGYLRGRRLQANEGTALVAGDFALGAGFGATASVSVKSGSNDQRGEFTVTANGAGIAANPAITLTYKDGSWSGNLPFYMVARCGGAQPTVPIDWGEFSTELQIAFRGTPVAGEQYTFRYQAIG